MIVIGENGSMEYRANPLRAAAEPQPSETPLPDDRVDTVTVTYSDGTMNTQPQPSETPLPARVPVVCEPLPDPEIPPLLNRFSHLVRHLVGILLWLGCAAVFYGLIFWGAYLSPPPPEPGLIYIPGHYIEYHDPY